MGRDCLYHLLRKDIKMCAHICMYLCAFIYLRTCSYLGGMSAQFDVCRVSTSFEIVCE